MPGIFGGVGCDPSWLLLDSRVVDLPLSYNPPSITLSALKPIFFKSLKNALAFSDNVVA